MDTFTPNANALALADALESGRFKQTTGILVRHEGGAEAACCLGVGCVLALEAGVPLDLHWRDTRFAFNSRITCLPESVRSWLGFKSDSGAYHDSEGHGRSLMADNDQRRDTFAQIAQTIRTTPSLYAEEGSDG